MLTTIILFLLISAFVINGLRKIPVHFVGQVTIFGERKERKYKEEGWRFLPLFPYVYGVILINMERITFNVIIEKVRTTDRAESKVPITLTVRPNKDYLVDYINSGKEEGIKTQLTGLIEERVREWCMGDEEGPSDWIELNKSQLEASSVLIKKIAGDALTPIPDYAQEVPTWIWMRYFSKPQPKIFFKNEEYWAEKDWLKVKNVVKKINKSDMDRLIKSIELRREEINAIRSGSVIRPGSTTSNEKLIIKNLGITIERLNIGDIDVLGEVGTKAEMQAKEEQERRSEETETTFLQKRIESYMKPPFNLSAEQALEVLQTERHKVTKNINEQKLSMSKETIEMFKGISSEVISQVFKKIQNK